MENNKAEVLHSLIWGTVAIVLLLVFGAGCKSNTEMWTKRDQTNFEKGMVRCNVISQGEVWTVPSNCVKN